VCPLYCRCSGGKSRGCRGLINHHCTYTCTLISGTNTPGLQCICITILAQCQQVLCNTIGAILPVYVTRLVVYFQYINTYQLCYLSIIQVATTILLVALYPGSFPLTSTRKSLVRGYPASTTHQQVKYISFLLIVIVHVLVSLSACLGQATLYPHTW